MRVPEMNPAKLPLLFRKELQLCRVKPGELVVLVSDINTRPEYVAAAFAAAEDLGATVYDLRFPRTFSTTHTGGELIGGSPGALDVICRADLCITFHIPLGSQWLPKARAAGTRFLMIYDHPDDLERLMSPPGLKEALLYTTDLVANSRHMRVTSAAGTDFQCALGDFIVECQYGYADEAGRVDHWGAGHFSAYPNVGSAEGTVVLNAGDAWILPYVRLIEHPVILTVEKGIVTKCEGGLDADLLRRFNDAHKKHPDDDEPWHISHLGWGLNPNAVIDQIAVHGNDIERVGGTGRSWAGNFLFSTGPNDQGGGSNSTLAHADLPMWSCTVELDGRTVIDAGRVVDPKMIVKPTHAMAVAV